MLVNGQGIEISNFHFILEKVKQRDCWELHQKVLDSPGIVGVRILLLLLTVGLLGNSDINVTSEIAHQLNQPHEVFLMYFILLESYSLSIT